jgi:hypothetical protein
MKAAFGLFLIGVAVGMLSCATSPTPVNCTRQGFGNGLSPAMLPSFACTSNSECNGAAKPVCASQYDNACICTARAGDGTCSTGQCVWHVDPSNNTCVCVPGQAQRCSLAGGAIGVQQCSANGATWGTCLALSSPVP